MVVSNRVVYYVGSTGLHSHEAFDIYQILNEITADNKPHPKLGISRKDLQNIFNQYFSNAYVRILITLNTAIVFFVLEYAEFISSLR